VYTHAVFISEGLLLGSSEGQQYFCLCFEFDAKNNISCVFVFMYPHFISC